MDELQQSEWLGHGRQRLRATTITKGWLGHGRAVAVGLDVVPATLLVTSMEKVAVDGE